MKPKYEREIEEILQRLGVQERRPQRWRLLWNRLTFNIRFKASRIRVPRVALTARDWLITSVILAVTALLLESLVGNAVAKLVAVLAVLSFFAPILTARPTINARYWRGRDMRATDDNLLSYSSGLAQRLRAWWHRLFGRRF